MLHWVQVNTGGHGIISKKFTKWLNIALFHEEVSHLKAWGMEHKDRTGANGQFTWTHRPPCLWGVTRPMATNTTGRTDKQEKSCLATSKPCLNWPNPTLQPCYLSPLTLAFCPLQGVFRVCFPHLEFSGPPLTCFPRQTQLHLQDEAEMHPPWEGFVAPQPRLQLRGNPLITTCQQHVHVFLSLITVLTEICAMYLVLVPPWQQTANPGGGHDPRSSSTAALTPHCRRHACLPALLKWRG